MSHRVPDFEIDDVYSLPTSSGLIRKSSMAEDEVMELLWQNGPVLAHSQNQRSGRRTSDHAAVPPPTDASEMRSTVEEAAAQQDHLFMQEDEMAAWLHYPLHETTFERDISEYFNPPPPPSTSVNTTISVALPQSEELKLSTSIELKVPPQTETIPALVATRPPVGPSAKQKEVAMEQPPPPPRKRVHNFGHFTKLPSMAASRPLSSAPPRGATDSTVVGSNDTPKVSQVGSSIIPEVEEGGGTSTRARDFTTTSNTYDFTLTSSSPGDSSASISASVEPVQEAAASQEEKKEAAMGEDRKRKGREADDNEGNSLEHDTEFEFEGQKKKSRGSTSTKRSRAAEVHNLSERRRRDRINERMKTLQELIPRCNKTDKASMLDEAIEYLKSLQLQVQMMSMGCGMMPIVYSGVQQYMPAMGMGMGMDLSMNRPILPYPQMLQGSSMPNPAPGVTIAPRFPMQAFPMSVVHDPSRMQAQNTADPMMNPMAAQNPHPNFINPYQQYLGPQPGQVLIPQQNQAGVQQNNAKPSTSRENANPESHQPGG